MSKFFEKTIHTESIYKGKVINVDVEDVELPDGQVSKRELVRHPGAVGILALTDEGRIVMVEQYRKALGKSIIEIPAGKLEEGEEPKITANRELEEETGYQANQLDYLVSYYTSPGFADEIIYLYQATGLNLLEQRPDMDEDEFVDLIEVTVEEALDLVKMERIHDAKTIQAIYYVMVERLKGE
ncbi:NUDIX domain-containing protein [Alkalibacillus salilacus]|uniref:ADP-ribose pyrophosphatase n=1 Tax=Alkalibacillus salilacus TaxID=284582 RepID=A0ABT9VC46_9BACI|nr:NUDIX hydrolase [Alkalibacillus salilacus]MDQ0158547.1 ADP-ribose pyrophosphatase [Alkalibacillus salilacus]